MKYLSLYLQIKEAYLYKRGKFSGKTITSQNGDLWSLIPRDISTKQEEGVDRLIKIRGLGCFCEMCLLAVSEAAPTKAQQHDCLNRS